MYFHQLGDEEMHPFSEMVFAIIDLIYLETYTRAGVQGYVLWAPWSQLNYPIERS